jgi:hypothetical protein
LHGTTLAKVQDVYGKFGEAASTMRLKCAPPSLIRSAPIANAIYDKVFNYSCPADCDSQSIIDIRPISDKRFRFDDNIPTQGIKQFDIKKAENTYTIEYINGQKTLRLSKNLTPRTLLTRCDTLSEATFAAIGDASNLRIDSLDKISGEGAVKFDLSGATGTGGVSIDLKGPVDLSQLESLGALFTYFKFPTASILTGVELRWGTSASSYWSRTVTAAQDRAFADNAWLLLNHQWNGASKVGSPISGAITHLEIIAHYTSGTAYVGAGIDNITAALGEAWEVVYYSNSLFTDTTGVTWKQEPTNDTDIIRLDDDGINILLFEFMLTLQQELKGKNMGSDYQFFTNQLDGRFGQRGIRLTQGLYELFNAKYPSQVPVREQTYYEFDALDGNGGQGDNAY